MHKSQCSDVRDMCIHDNATSVKVTSRGVMAANKSALDGIPARELKRMKIVSMFQDTIGWWNKGSNAWCGRKIHPTNTQKYWRKKPSEMLEMKNHWKSNKNSVKSLSSRTTKERSEYLSLKTIVEGRAQSSKTKDGILIDQWEVQDILNTEKPKRWVMGIDEGWKSCSKGLQNTF